MLTEQQVQNRKNGIGASEAAVAMGLVKPTSSRKIKTPYQLWMIKTGRMEAEDISDVAPVYWGNVHEDTIAKEYAKRMGCNVHTVPETLHHKDHPFMLCHLDRKVEGIDKLLECKFAMFARDEWGESGSDIVPESYIIQVQHQLAVTGYPEGDLAVLIGGWDFRVYHFKRDEQIIAKIIEELSEFWDCVQNDTPPPIRDRTDTALAFPSSSMGKAKEADKGAKQVVDSLKEVKATLRQYEEQKKSLETKLTCYMEDAECLRVDNTILATWKSTARGNRVLRVMGE